jgi:hypothetical protein
MKISKSSIPLPDKDKLDKLILSSYEEVCSLRLSFQKKETDFEYTKKFIFASIERIADLLLAISKLSYQNIDSMHILMRSDLEVNVDLLWLYKIYNDNKDQGEKLARRFFQFGAVNYLKISKNYEGIFEVDSYLKKINKRYSHNKFSEDAKNLKLVELVDSGAKKELQILQKNDWHCLPGLIKNKKEITFRSRSEIASEMAKNLFNLKYAPYHQNWTTLNAFTHWSAAKMKFFDDEVSEAFYLRNLNASLGFLHDVLNVGYNYLQINPPTKVRMMRQEFHYFST